MLQKRYIFGLVLLFAQPAYCFDSVQLKKTLYAPASSKSFSPTCIAVDDSGRTWVTDPQNNRLLLFTAAGDFLQAVGERGSGAGQFQQPEGVAVDADGNAYVADSGNGRIQVFSPDAKFVTAFGERGSDPGQFKTPWTIAVSRDGVVVVADKEADHVQLFSKDGVFLHTLDVGAPVDGLAIDPAGRIYTSHVKLRQVEIWSPAGQLLKTFTGGEPGVKPFDKPLNLAVSAAGLVYVTEPGASRFRELDPAGHTLGVFGRSGTGDGQFKGMEGIAVKDETVYVCDSRNHRIALFSLSRPSALPPLTPVAAARLQVSRKPALPIDVDRLAWNSDGSLHALSFSRGEVVTFDISGSTVARIDLKNDLGIRNPSGITTAPSSGALFIADAGDDRVVKIDKKTGKVVLEFGKSTSMFKSGQGELSKPQGIACSPQGVLFVADSGSDNIQAFNHQGMFQFSSGEKGSDHGQLRSPVSVAWDKDRLYVADPGNRKVVTFNGTGRFLHETGIVGPETLVDPRQVAVDREGNLFVLDAARGRVVAYDPQGIYLGGFGSTGRGEGFLNHPRGFALNDNGDLFVAEEGRIKAFHVVLLPPPPLNVVATPGEGYVSLKWDAVPARYPVRYIVYRSTPAAEAQRLKDTVDTATTDDTLSSNTTYTYMILSQSVQGATSVPSAPVSVAARALASGPRLEIVNAQIDDVFSAHYKYYGRVPLGHVIIRNNGLPPVQKIKVSFAIQGYMDYPSETPIPELHSMEERDIPLLATFNNRILEVTETTPIQAQVKLTFYNGDQASEVVRNLPFKLYSRNTTRWDKKDRFAAFVTPNDPPVIDFARGVATSFAEAHQGAPVPSSLETAWAVFEGLGTYGITYLPRPNNPYDRVSLDSTTVDSLQFARETLSRKSGDCADVVALLASALESLTVTTCALDAPGHLFLMFDTGESDKAALSFPEDWVVPYAGTYWIPVEATMLGSPFLEAWKQGAEEYRRWSQQGHPSSALVEDDPRSRNTGSGGKVTPIDIHLAWRTFEPATLPEIASGAKPPTREQIEEKFLPDWKALVNLRWQTGLEAGKQAAAAAPAAGEPWLHLGFLAVEFRKYDDAKEYFMKARDDQATAAAAYNNLGNLAFIRGDLTSAESDYTSAKEKDTTDGQVLINLARVYLKQGLKQKATATFERGVTLDPSLREQYPDVSTLTP